jgi:hypothetical protein
MEILLPDVAVPFADERACSVKLTFEVTDYDKMEWNYCQKKTFNNPAGGVTQCKSNDKNNDKNSFITSGPNGAGAGYG